MICRPLCLLTIYLCRQDKALEFSVDYYCDIKCNYFIIWQSFLPCVIYLISQSNGFTAIISILCTIKLVYESIIMPYRVRD